MSAGFARPDLLVSTDWLAARLDDPGTRIVDCTTHLAPFADLSHYEVVSGRGDFERAHIPGASFLDIEHEASQPHPRLHFTLPPAEAFAAAMARLGIGDDTLVVSYSTANHWWATRLWWMLRVFGHERAAVLDGGLQRWEREGRPVERGPARPRPPAPFTPRFRPELVATRQDVLAAIEDAGVCTVNALRPEQHAGRGGVHYGRPGHITGSVNIPAVAHVDAANVLRSPAELRALFQPALAAPRVITYCGGGIAATSVALVLAMLGKDAVQVYDASLTEWASDPTLPMQTGV